MNMKLHIRHLKRCVYIKDVICENLHFCHSLCSFNHKYYHKHVITADLGGHSTSIRQVFVDDIMHI